MEQSNAQMAVTKEIALLAQNIDHSAVVGKPTFLVLMIQVQT